MNGMAGLIMGNHYSFIDGMGWKPNMLPKQIFHLKAVCWLTAWVFFLGACTSASPANESPLMPVGEIIVVNRTVAQVSDQNMPVAVGEPAPPGLWKSEITEGEWGYRLWHGNCTGTGRLLQCEGGLELVQKTDPTQPVRDRYHTPQDATAVAVAPPYVLVTWCTADPLAGASDSGGGLKVLHHVASEKLVEVGSLETSCTLEIVLEGNRAYLLTWQGLVVVDISQPVTPIQRGIFTGEGYPTQAAIAGHSAYVSWLAPCTTTADGLACDRSLRLLDVSNPESITEMGSYNLTELLPNRSTEKDPQMTIHDEYLYVPLGNNRWQLFSGT